MKVTTMMFKTLFFASAALLVGQSANNKANLSVLTSRILSLTDQARQAISINNKDSARIDVDAALQLADKVLSRSQTRLVPIYTELDEISILEPIQAEKARRAGQADRTPGAQPAGSEGEVIQTIAGKFYQYLAGCGEGEGSASDGENGYREWEITGRRQCSGRRADRGCVEKSGNGLTIDQGQTEPDAGQVPVVAGSRRRRGRSAESRRRCAARLSDHALRSARRRGDAVTA